MKIHEYQAKQILRDAGVAVPRGIVADTPQAVVNAYHSLGGAAAVVKAQIHAGGRGKGTIQDIPEQHGVQLVRAAEEAGAAASQPARPHAGHRADRPAGPSRPPRARRAGVRHRPRAVPWHRGRSGRGDAGPDRVGPRRHGHRACRRPAPGGHLPRGVPPGRRAAELPGPKAGRTARPARGRDAPRGAVHAGAVPGVRGSRLQAWWRSTRWCSPPRANWWRWTRR